MIDSRSSHAEDLFSMATGPGTASGMTIKRGMAGWASEADVADMGDGSAGADGRTLARVTLFEGRNPNVKPTPGIAEGDEILAQVGWPFFVIPPKGMMVLVAFPGGAVEEHGGGAIIFVYDNSPKKRFSKDRANINFGAMHLVIEAKSITLKDESKHAIVVGAPPAGGDPGIGFFTPGGGSGGRIEPASVAFWAADGGKAVALLQLSTNQAALTHKDGGFVKIKSDGSIYVSPKGDAFIPGAHVWLGPNIPPAVPFTTPALYGLTGMAGLPSTTVIISP